MCISSYYLGHMPYAAFHRRLLHAVGAGTAGAALPACSQKRAVARQYSQPHVRSASLRRDSENNRRPIPRLLTERCRGEIWCGASCAHVAWLNMGGTHIRYATPAFSACQMETTPPQAFWCKTLSEIGPATHSPLSPLAPTPFLEPQPDPLMAPSPRAQPDFRHMTI